MKYTKQIPAVLLGVLFVFGGIAYFFKLIPMPDIKTFNADEQSFTALFESTGYMKFIKVLEVAFGALLLIPKTRALGLILIAPIIVNIACYEIFFHRSPGIGVAMIMLNAIGIFLNKEKYQGIIS